MALDAMDWTRRTRTHYAGFAEPDAVDLAKEAANRAWEARRKEARRAAGGQARPRRHLNTLVNQDGEPLARARMGLFSKGGGGDTPGKAQSAPTASAVAQGGK